MRDSLVLSLAAALAALGCSAGPGGGTRDAGPGGSMDAGPGGGTDAGPGAGTDSGGPPPPPPDAVPPGPDAGCEATTPVPATIVGDPPDMLLVVDISGSMCVSVSVFPPSGDTRLEVMRRALDGLVTSKDARINFGMMLFPGDNACAPGTVRNGVAPRNASAIRATLGGLTTDMFGCALRHSGATPTHTSLDAARTYYGTIPVNPVGQFVLLATDGLPNCGPPLPDGGTEETVDETVAAIEALFAAGISTYVLGFGDSFGGGGTALNRMATAGGTSRPYNARTAAELDTALDAIAASVIPPSCTVMLDGPSRDPRLFRVSFDSGPLIARDESRRSGWDYDAATNTITFYGAECARVQSGTVTNVEVDFGCPGPLI
ncbi:MAG: VWA domain-containing protein [Sandaracinaceae bacterium]|nr:VWA domain-containing protein [Sandaracinaceae bacterium]